MAVHIGLVSPGEELLRVKSSVMDAVRCGKYADALQLLSTGMRCAAPDSRAALPYGDGCSTMCREAPCLHR